MTLLQLYRCSVWELKLALDVDDGAVMKHTVKYGGSNGDIGKDLIPLGKGFVGSEDSRSLFVSFSDKLKEWIGSLNIHR